MKGSSDLPLIAYLKHENAELKISCQGCGRIRIMFASQLPWPDHFTTEDVRGTLHCTRCKRRNPHVEVHQDTCPMPNFHYPKS